MNDRWSEIYSDITCTSVAVNYIFCMKFNILFFCGYSVLENVLGEKNNQWWDWDLDKESQVRYQIF